jgi:NAD+ kinase
MKVLVMRKTTGFDIRGEFVRKKVASGSLDASHLDVLKQAHKEHYQTLDKLHAALHSKKIGHYDVTQGRYWPDLTEYDALIAVGGDGTVLEASHHVDSEDMPVIGIRSSKSSVGHLCLCSGEEVERAIDQLLQGHLNFTKVSRMQAVIQQIDTNVEFYSAPVLNEFLFTNENPAAITKYRLKIGDRNVIQRSSGVWISTSAGSTAAIYAAGGLKMELDHSDFQYLVRELYRANDQSFEIETGFFSPDQCCFEIQNLNDNAVLALDGAHRMIRLNYGDNIQFMRASPLCLATGL